MANDAFMEMVTQMSRQLAVFSLYRQAEAIDPVSIHIPALFLADWLEDRGIPADPLREYARQFPDD